MVQYVREVFRLLGDDMAYGELGEQAMDYTLKWIDFVLNKCERGRGTLPRYRGGGTVWLKVVTVQDNIMLPQFRDAFVPRSDCYLITVS